MAVTSLPRSALTLVADTSVSAPPLPSSPLCSVPQHFTAVGVCEVRMQVRSSDDSIALAPSLSPSGPAFWAEAEPAAGTPPAWLSALHPQQYVAPPDSNAQV